MNKRFEFAQRIKKLRKESGLSASEFAELLGIKLQTYYTYERGIIPSFDVLVGIAQKIDISLDWLCGVTPLQTYATKQNDVTTILNELLKACEAGQKIEIQVTTYPENNIAKRNGNHAYE